MIIFFLFIPVVSLFVVSLTVEAPIDPVLVRSVRPKDDRKVSNEKFCVHKMYYGSWTSCSRILHQIYYCHAYMY